MNVFKLIYTPPTLTAVLSLLFVDSVVLGVDLNSSVKTPDQHYFSPATDPELPVVGSSLIPPDEIPQSALDWRFPHSPQIARFTLIAGDQGGGPIRYNTRFPEVKGNPHPASYYHAAPFLGAEMEFSLARGGILIGGLARRDLWHQGIVGRSVQGDGGTWVVNHFGYRDSAFILGWVFGERYREVPWTSDLSLIYDSGTIAVKMSRLDDGLESEGRVRLIALSMRARLQLQLWSVKRASIGFGPEFHLPIYYSTATDSDLAIQGILKDNLKFKSASAIGAGMTASFVL